MPTKVLMPQLGESVDEGTITRWLKQPGETVEEYEPLLEVNTDKVDSEIPSPSEGVLLEIVVPEGTTVQAGELLAWIGKEGESPPDGADGAGEAEAAPAPPEEAETEAEPTDQAAPEAAVPEPSIQAAPAEDTPLTPPSPGRDKDLGFISPIVAKIAAEQNVDLRRVTGTGQDRRITKKDVLSYLETREEEAPAEPAVSTPTPAERPAPAPAPQAIPGEVLPMTAVRRSIAEHMVRSRRTSPHVSTIMEADMSRVVAHRLSHKEQFSRSGAKLTFTPYFVQASVVALKMYPIVNSSWSDEGVIIHPQINVGMATALGEGGLIVPVIKNADSLSLLGIARQVNDLADRARTKQLQPSEVQGGTFTITNHGTSGSLFATPIINQPQCAILGVGVIQKRVVVVDDMIAIRPMVYLSLTFDHRILDGAIADYFLGKVVEYLENWS